MAQIQRSYDKAEDVPEALKEFYTETGGKWVLNLAGTDPGLAGMKKTLDTVREELKAERAKTAKIGDRDIDALIAAADEAETLRLAAKGMTAEEQAAAVKEQVQAKLANATAGKDRKITELTNEITGLKTQITDGQARDKQRTINEAVRAAAAKSGCLPGSVSRITTLGVSEFELNDDGKVVTKGEGLTPDDWVNNLKTTDAYFWPPSEGGGAGKGNNGRGGGGNSELKGALEEGNITKLAKIKREMADDVKFVTACRGFGYVVNPTTFAIKKL